MQVQIDGILQGFNTQNSDMTATKCYRSDMSKKKEHMTRTQLGSLAKEALVDCALSFQKDNASLSSRQEKLSGRL